MIPSTYQNETPCGTAQFCCQKALSPSLEAVGMLVIHARRWDDGYSCIPRSVLHAIGSDCDRKGSLQPAGSERALSYRRRTEVGEDTSEDIQERLSRRHRLIAGSAKLH